jgi:hypothetical protein
MFKLACAFFPATQTSGNVSLELENPRIIGQRLPRGGEFSQSPVILEVTPVKMLCTCKVCFARIWAEPKPPEGLLQLMPSV